MEQTGKLPRCKNGTRRRANYNNECMSDEEYRQRQLEKKGAKRQTQKKKDDPSLFDSIKTVFNSLTPRGNNTVNNVEALPSGAASNPLKKDGRLFINNELKRLELINADEYKRPVLQSPTPTDKASVENNSVNTEPIEAKSVENRPLIVDSGSSKSTIDDQSSEEDISFMEDQPSSTESVNNQPSTESVDNQPSSESVEVDKTSSESVEVDKTSSESVEVDKTSSESVDNQPSTKSVEDKTNDFLYPSLDDPFLNQKIAKRNEFSAFTYDADITRELKETSDLICSNPEFELNTRQLFVKTFISYNTPYKGLLIYHGVGTGKTCSAIGIAEELRDHMKNAGITQRILIIASTNVQDNFRLQLFDESRLEQDSETGAWTSKSCIGNKLIREINPVGGKMTREKIASQAKTIINSSYAFMGYLQFANFIQEKVFESVSEDEGKQAQQEQLYAKRPLGISTSQNANAFHEQLEIQNIQRIFNDRLIIIDEVHNCTKEDKRLAKLLLKIAAHADNLRIILMTATPMFNSPREIIWICNLLNINDRRATIQYEDVFTKEGALTNPDLLRQKLNGYVSYVRGENPYTFPFRIYPDAFAPDNADRAGDQADDIANILYYTNLDPYQQESYDMVVRQYIGENEVDMNDESYGYSQLQMPLQALNMTFYRLPGGVGFVGKEGLQANMNFVEKVEKKKDAASEYRKYNYEYKTGIPRIFHETELRKYSSKIADICSCIRRSRGIIIVYTQYIDGGIVPVSLALEEMGFTRFGTSAMATPLFKPGAIDSPPIDARTMMPAKPGEKFNQARYMILSGDKYFSQNNADDINYATREANKHGDFVRVILISRAASEGLDFKYVRQVHILDPWYNLNRIEQIVGRGVRNQSHCRLEFEERNVEIYLHAALSGGSAAATQSATTVSGDSTASSSHTESTEQSLFSADLYVYRYAEKKAQNIGQVTRLLKQISVDCVLNHSQTNFTDVNMTAVGRVMIQSSTMSEPQWFQVGDKPNSYACDYMEDCEYKCLPEEKMPEQPTGAVITKPSSFILQKLMDKIASIIGREIALHYDVLEKMLGYPSKYNLYFALTELIKNPTATFTDKYGRTGRLINRDKYYLFQPIEVTDPHSSVFDSMVPVQVKNERVRLGIPADINVQVLPEVLPKVQPKVQSKVQSVAEESLPVAEESLPVAEESLPVAVKTPKPMGVRSIMAEIEMVTSRALGAPLEIQPNDEDWYNHMNNFKAVPSKKKPKDFADYTAKKMLLENHGIDEQALTLYIWDHALNTLDYKDRVTLAKWVFSESPKTSDLEKHVEQYFKYLVFKVDEIEGIVIAKDDENILFNLADWTEMPYKQETFDLEYRERFFVEPTKFPKIVGFFGGFKTGYPVFKIKQLLLKRNNPGAYLMQEAKGDITTILNSVLKYAGIKVQYDAATTVKMSKIALGIILEIVMMNHTPRDVEIDQRDNVWYMRQEMANYNKIQKLKL
jgi:hypothetical protein